MIGIRYINTGIAAVNWRYGTVSSQITKLKMRISLILQVRQERGELGNVSEEILRDIGVSRIEADRESRKSILELPPARISHATGERKSSASWLEC